MYKDKFDRVKESYENIEIPNELDFMVRSTLKNGMRMKKMKKNITKTSISAVSVVILLFVVINISPAIANSMKEIPVIGALVKIITLKTYTVDEVLYDADIVVSKIDGLEDKDIQDELNEKYEKESLEEYEAFIKEIEEMKLNNEGNKAVSTGMKIITDNDEVLSVLRWKVEAMASSKETHKYDTVLKKEKKLLKLPMLFVDDSYIKIISEDIISQMKKQMEEEEHSYFIKGENEPEGFEKIDANQNFYINENGNLVICFDEYEVAPGCEGTVEFIVNRDILEKIESGIYIFK